mgnify:CR=1 FL=1
MVLYCRCMIVLSISFVSFRYVTLRWFLSICSFLRFRISLARSLIRSFALVRTSFRGWLALWCFSHTGLYLPSQRKTFYCVRSLLFLQERKKSAGVSREAVRCLSLSDSLSRARRSRDFLLRRSCMEKESTLISISLFTLIFMAARLYHSFSQHCRCLGLRLAVAVVLLFVL